MLKKLAALAALCIVVVGLEARPSGAQVPISGLPAATPSPTDVVPIVHGGVTSKATVQQVSDAANPANTVLAIPAGTTMVFEGDSYTAGTGATSCVPSTHSGTCFADLVTSFFSGSEVNSAVSGSCLENLSPSCSSSSSSLMLRYTTTLTPYAGPNTYFFLNIGSNDAVSVIAAPAMGASVSTFASNYQTIISALIAGGTKPEHIIVAESPLQIATPASLPWLAQFNMALARIAKTNGLRLALSFAVNAACPTTCYGAGGVHTNDAGHAGIAVAYENATAYNANASLAANGALAAVSAVPFSGSGQVTGSAASRSLVTDANGYAIVAADLPVLLSGAQTKAGVLTLSSPPVMSGASITSATIPQGSLGAFSAAQAFASNVGVGGAATNLFALDVLGTTNDGVRFKSPSSAPFLRFDTGAAGAANRNYVIIANPTTGGDLAIKQSNALGGDPVAAGTNRLYIDASGNWTGPVALTATGALTAAAGCTGGHAVTGAAGFYSGTGVPSCSAPSGSLYARFDGAANARLYINTSTASTSGTTWSALTTP